MHPVPSAAPRCPGCWQVLLITRYPHPGGKGVRNIKQPQEQQVKRMNLNVPIELHNSFKSLTAAQGENMTDVLLEYIRAYVIKYSSSKPKGRGK